MAQYNSANNTLQGHNKTLFEVNMTNNESIFSAAWNLQVARGKIPGVSLVNLYGYQSSVGSTWIPVWENATTYTYPSDAGEQMVLYSSSASDTDVTIFIDGLDINHNVVQESLVLTNGATGVTTVNSYHRINSMRTTGSVNSVGIIRLANLTKTTTFAQINVGVGKTQWSLYNVPAGYTFYLNRVTAAASATNSAKVLGYRVYQQFNGLQALVLQSPWIDTYETLRVIPNPYQEKTSIQWQVNSDTTSQVGVRVEGVLINNSLL
jgi:hypothetical protein